MATALLKLTDVQLGTSVTASNNFVLYQPASPDGTVRLGNGNSGSVTDVVTITSAGNTTITGTATAKSFTPSSSTVPANGLFLPAANTLAWATNSTEGMRLDSSGRVGIGVVPTTSYGPFNVNVNGTSFHVGYGANYDNYYTCGSSGIQVFRQGTTENARIDASGNLLVGATNATTYYGNNRLVSRASSNATNAALLYTDWSGDLGYPALYLGKYDNNTTTSQIYVRFLNGAAVNAGGQINANGSGQAAFGGWSDARLKENIVDLPSQLENICSLRPVEFDYKTGGHQIGFIAQEMQEVYPDVVGEDTEGMLTVTGWSKTEARLVKAIQELKAELDAATARITELEAK